MPDSVRLVGIKAKIKRANEHVRNLASEIQSWNTPDRYAFGPDDDPKTGDEVFRIYGNDLTPPPIISVIAGEIIHDLRSALDHLAWQLVDAHSGKLGRRIQFLVFDEPHTIQEYEAKVKRMINGASHSAMHLVKGMEAYKGGNAPYLVSSAQSTIWINTDC